MDTEFDNFKKKHKDWVEVLPKLYIAIQYQREWREDSYKIDPKEFIPKWKMFQTWINQRDWEMNMGELPKTQETGMEQGFREYDEKKAREK